jgi:signal transduction histidine kinase
VAAFKLSDADIDMGYLCTELEDAQISPSGAYIPNFTRSSILRMKLYFPPTLDEQKKIYLARKKESVLSKAKEAGLQEVIEQMKGDFLNEIRTRKHDMMPHVRQVASACKNIDYYLSHRQEISDNEIFEGIKEEVTNQKHAIESLTTLLKIFSREEQFGTPEVINIDKFLTEHYTNGRNYTILHETDYIEINEYGNIPEIDVNMAPDDLLRLCDNIVNNAVKHGFTDPQRTDYCIVSELTIDRERDMFKIDFRNNGTPLPKGLDKNRYGIRGEKAGNTAGNGEGGHIVKSIVEHYGGDFDIFSDETEKGYLTTVRIYLPIYRS